MFPSSDKKKRKGNAKNDREATNQMITPKVLALSLSPPRVPPFGTMQRSLYHARVIDDRKVVVARPLASQLQRYHVRKVLTSRPEGSSTMSLYVTLHEKFLRQLQMQKHRQRSSVYQPHPHLLERSADTTTRSIGYYWPVQQQNWFRDSGTFRCVVDILVAITGVPALVFTTLPQDCIFPFLRLTRMCQKIPYGPHRLQYIHLYHFQQEPKGSLASNHRLIVFVHGGAWGSGHPWMYRLIAGPFLFSLKNQYSVAVVGYRTYPDGGSAADQVADVSAALNLLLTSQYSHLYDDSNITIMGHSSGAHIALLFVVDRIVAELALLDKRRVSRPFQAEDRNLENRANVRLPFDSFCGISGPYDISHHFDYEASRGVEELSPMKPVNGFTRLSFQRNSPALRLQYALRNLSSQAEAALNQVCPHIALIHGVEDDTVPFTATSEAGRLFRSLGLTRVQEIYIPNTGHQDAIVQCMLGGKVSEEVLEWIDSNVSLMASSNVVAKRLATRSRL